MSAPRRDGQQNDDAYETKAKIITETDFMLKIMTATPASMVTASATGALSTVNVQNKCATPAPTTFSYQRAAKRCARFEQPTLDTKKETATTTNITCERQRRLAEQKAQLRAAFFKDFNVLAAQQQRLQQTDSRAERTAAFGIQQLIEKFEAMIVQQPTTEQQQQLQLQQQQQQAQLKPALLASSAANSDEGCNAGCGLSPCSSDNECDANVAAAVRRKPKVTRCASSDSALGLEVDDVNMELLTPATQRRMTLTVTDLPLRPALLPLAEPTALPDSPLPSPTGINAAGIAALGAAANVAGIPSKVLLEERVVAALSAPSSSRRESTQSCISDMGGVRYVRTPSVVVSDYSDDITACGISMEEMEYFRLQRSRCPRRCSLEASAAAANSHGSAKDEAQSDVSAASSCSNLYYCGSTISALDGGECIVNGVRVTLNRKSSHSSSGDDDDDDEEELELEEEEEAEREQELELEEVDMELQQQQRERERQLSDLLAATQLGDVSKKVGSSSRGVNVNVNVSANVNVSSNAKNDDDDADNGNVTFIGNLN